MNLPTPSLVVVIPAFRPGRALIETVTLLRQQNMMLTIVDDGSGPAYQTVFDTVAQYPEVQLLRHYVNLGKGAALKTGINHVLVTFPECRGVITADADGQHRTEDILKVANRLDEDPNSLVLGVREFDSNTPLRSRFGNEITRNLFRMIHGEAIADTQTGLRGIPRAFAARLLKLETRGYEFELDMLIMSKYAGIPIIQVPIQTIYIDENLSSHFNPLLDSMRIYFLLLRFAAASAITAVIDNVIFYLAYSANDDTAIAQILARSVALFVNYRLNRQLVFHSSTAGSTVWLRFVGVVITSGLMSYAILYLLVTQFQWNVMTAKFVAEGLLFLFNFAFLRDFVFTQPSSAPQSTDWSEYYQSVPPTARITRRYTTKVIIDSLMKFASRSTGIGILEFGGANSCFLDAIVDRFRPSSYHVADTNQYGLDLLKGRDTGDCRVHLYNADILKTQLPEQFDVVFSIGLIEHFDSNGTAEAIRSHFRHVKPGGLVLISFPRPTFLYRIARGALETLGLWKFPDERPLHPREVLQSVDGLGSLLFQKTLWPLILTQHMIVIKARS